MHHEPSYEEISRRTAEHVAVRVAKVVAVGFAVVIGVIVVGFALAWVVQFLWNETLASEFKLPTINYWQAFALFLLAKILFGFGNSGGFMPHRHSGHHNGRRHGRARHRHHGIGAESDLPAASDEQFKRYWQAEGKAAFEEFLSKRNAGQSDKA